MTLVNVAIRFENHVCNIQLVCQVRSETFIISNGDVGPLINAIKAIIPAIDQTGEKVIHYGTEEIKWRVGDNGEIAPGQYIQVDDGRSGAVAPF